MLTYEEKQARQAAFERAVMDARASDAAPTCPLTRDACAGRTCACAMRTGMGWICGLTRNHKDARARVVDVDADALLKGENRLAALTYMERGCLYA